MKFTMPAIALDKNVSHFLLIGSIIAAYLLSYKYYPAEKADDILDEFIKKHGDKLGLWKIIAISSFIIPVILFLALGKWLL